MKADQLKALQAPLKARYREQPEAARVTFRSSGTLDPSRLVCQLSTHGGAIESGLHPAAGGERPSACSGDLMLDALVACAGVTLNVVATAMQIELRSGHIEAEAEFDFRGTLGVDKEVPVGISHVQLTFQIDADADDAQLEKLISLTERYCVIFQTLQHPPRITTGWNRPSQD